MEITYIVIITIITYIFGAFTKLKVDTVPNKFIPIQNVLIGLLSALVCFFCGVETNLLQSFALCLTASMGAGGLADLKKVNKEEE